MVYSTIVVLGAYVLFHQLKPVRSYSGHNCDAAQSYTVRAINLNVREQPGKFPGNTVITTLPQNSSLCATGRTSLFNERDPKLSLWIEVRTEAGVKGWVNRCLITNPIEGSHIPYC